MSNRNEKDLMDQSFESIFGITSRRAQGMLLGGAAAALVFLTPSAIKEQKNINRYNAAVKLEQKLDARSDILAKKYDIKKLSQESQDAFWRLVDVRPYDIGDTEMLYQDAVQTGEWLQQDVAVLSAELVNNGGTTNEYDLAREIIPEDTLKAMAQAGFEFTPLDPVHCDVGDIPSYRPFDYTNHLGRELKVKYRKGGKTIRIPLGARQTPVKPEPYKPSPFYFPADPPINSELAGIPRDPKESELSSDRFYRVAGCETLPRQLDDREKPVKWVYSE